MSVDSILHIALDSMQENVALARYQAELGLEIAQKAENTPSIIKAYAILSDCYYQRNDLETALQYSVKAERLSLKNEKYILDYIYLNQGYLLCMMDKCTEGLKMLTEAEKIAQSHNNFLSLFKCMINKGLIYQAMGTEDSAIVYFRKAIRLHEMHAVGEVAVCYNNIGNYFEEKNDLDSAFYYYNEAWINNKESQDYNLRTIILYGLASITSSKKDFRNAMKYADSSLVLSQKISFIAGIKDAVKLKANILHQQGFEKEAYYLLDSMDGIIESVNFSNSGIEKKFDALDTFQKEDIILEKENTTSNKVILILALAIMLMLLYIYRKNLPFVNK